MRNCLKEPIPEIFQGAELLGQAANYHLNGDREACAAKICAADISAIAEWTSSIWGKFDASIHARFEMPAPLAYLPKEARHAQRMPNKSQRRQVIDRDGYHCRFCGIPVIPKEVRDLLHKAYPEAARWGSKVADQHAALQAMWLQFDHIVPHTRGGQTIVDNLVVTCGPCNFGRAQYAIEEMGIFHPLNVQRDPAWDGHQDWDGLTRLLAPTH